MDNLPSYVFNLQGVLNRCEDESKKIELKAFVRCWCEEKYSSGEISSYMLGYLVDIIQQVTNILIHS